MTGPARGLQGASVPGAQLIELADPAECWSRLRSARRAVLSSRDPRRPVSVEVAYTVDVDEVVVPVARDDRALPLLDGLPMSLVLAGRSEDQARWVVRLTGVVKLAHALPRPVDLDVRRARRPVRVAETLVPQTLLVGVHRLRGYHEVPFDPP